MIIPVYLENGHRQSPDKSQHKEVEMLDILYTFETCDKV